MELKNMEDGAQGVAPDNWPELLAALPYIAGVKLERTIAACLMAHGKSEAFARVAGDAGPDELAEIVLTANKVHPQLDGVILVAYTDVTIEDVITRELMVAGAMRIIRGGVKVFGIAHVGSDGWIVYKQFAEDERGTLDQIAVPEEFAEVIPTAHLKNDRDLYLPIVQPDTDQHAFLMSMFGIALEIREMADEDNLLDRPVQERRMRLIEKYDPVAIFERVATEDYESFSMRDRCIVLMLWETRSLRDLAIIQFGTSAEHARDMLPRHISDDDATDEDYMAVVGLGVRPPESRLRHVIDFTRKLAGLFLHEERGTSPWAIQPMTVGGWAAWAEGKSTSACAMFDIAIESGKDEQREEYELAEHLRKMANSGRLPGWAYDGGVIE